MHPSVASVVVSPVSQVEFRAMGGTAGRTSRTAVPGDAWLEALCIPRLLRDNPPIVYQLLIRVYHPAPIRISRRAPALLAVGWYIYSGSARRASSARLARHLRKRKVCRWHIDYLLTGPRARVTAVRFWPWKPGLECAVNQALLKAGAQTVVRGFGNGDCERSCPAHLLFLSGPPDGITGTSTT